MLHRSFILNCLLLAATGYSAFASDRYWTNTPSTGYTAGDTVHLFGTFTNTLSITNSGTPGNPITFFFEPGTKFSAPTLPDGSSFISAANQSWLVLDGGSNGIVELTDNGTRAAYGGPYDFAANITGVSLYPANHVTVQNLTVRNIYVRTTNAEPIQGTGDGTGISVAGSDILLTNCFVTDAMNGIMHLYGAQVNSNFNLVGCTLSNYNHGYTLGSGGVTNPVFLNVSITHNTFQGGDTFESPDGVELGLHRNPIFFFNESPDRSGCISNILISQNFIKHGYHPQSHTAGTGAMFFDFYNNQMARHVRVFNNVSTLVSPLNWSGGGGMISGRGIDVLVANNTAVGWQTTTGLWGGGEISANGSNVWVLNNVCVSGAGITLGTTADTTGLTNSWATQAALMSTITSDFNIFNGQGPNSFYGLVFSQNPYAVSGMWDLVDTFSQWTNAFSLAKGFHFDLHSTTASVQLNTNFSPAATDTVAIGQGTNLTAWGITNDYAGNPRPAIGNWTIGAYEVPKLQTTSLAAPTYLHVVFSSP